MKRKVTGLTAAVMCLILLGLDSFIYFTLHRHLMYLENNLVISRAQTIAQSLTHLDERELTPMGVASISHQIASYASTDQSILVLDATGAKVAHVGTLSVSQMVSAFNPNNVAHSIPMKIGHAWYMTVAVYVSGPEDAQPDGVVVLSADIQSIEDNLETLLTILILGSIGAVALAAAGGYAISAAAARPIDQMIRLVGHIQAGTTNDRLPLPRGSDEVARLAFTFNQMLDRIERSFQQQAQFVADASHEIRTPLTTIQGYARLLGRWGKQQPEVLEKAISVIEKESARLHSLTDDMLTLADMESSQQALSRTCDVHQAITDVLEPYELLYPDHPISYHRGRPLQIAMAPEHFGRVLTNLVDNAIKYTEAGGRIEVMVASEAGRATITVNDSGQGIPEEDLPRIFDRFYRVDKARSRTAGGNGLGLAIVRELVELYQGEIWATSKVDQGTSVSFSLPLAPQGQKEDSKEPYGPTRQG